MSTNMLRTVGSHKASTQKVHQKSEFTCDMFFQKLGQKLGKQCRRRKHITDLNVESFQPQNSQRLYADIDWYVRMPTDSPPADPKAERLPQLCEEEDATLEPTFHVIDSHLPN